MQKRNFIARDGVSLAYDDFVANEVASKEVAAKACLIFLHGSTYNSRRYANIGKAMANKGYQVCLLNWRGHGESGGKPGDVDYVGQLEDDLADMIAHIKSKDAASNIMIGGHSAGAVVCLRYIDSYGCDDISAVSIVSPAINGPLETVRYPQASSAWQYKLTYFRKAKAIEAAPESALQHAPILNMGAFWMAKLVPFLRHRTILNFPASERMAKLEGRVLGYSYNLMLSCDINGYPRAFNKINVPVFLLVGEEDEVIHSHLLETIYHWHLMPNISKSLIKVPKANHIRILPATCNLLPTWLEEVFGFDYEIQKMKQKASFHKPATHQVKTDVVIMSVQQKDAKQDVNQQGNQQGAQA